MKAKEIEVGGVYRAAVSNRIVDVRVDRVREQWDTFSRSVRTRYEVTNLRTGRKLVFRSAQKFRSRSVTLNRVTSMRADGSTFHHTPA